MSNRNIHRIDSFDGANFLLDVVWKPNLFWRLMGLGSYWRRHGESNLQSLPKRLQRQFEIWFDLHSFRV